MRSDINYERERKKIISRKWCNRWTRSQVKSSTNKFNKMQCDRARYSLNCICRNLKFHLQYHCHQINSKKQNMIWWRSINWWRWWEECEYIKERKKHLNLNVVKWSYRETKTYVRFKIWYLKNVELCVVL